MRSAKRETGRAGGDDNTRESTVYTHIHRYIYIYVHIYSTGDRVGSEEVFSLVYELMEPTNLPILPHSLFPTWYYIVYKKSQHAFLFDLFDNKRVNTPRECVLFIYFLFIFVSSFELIVCDVITVFCTEG